MDTRQFHKQLFDASRWLIPRGSTVVCAVSGGADSMAMLSGLHAVNTMRRCGWTLHVAHLDHHLPHDSAAMMAFVRRAAAGFGLPCTTDVVDVIALSRASGRSVEEVGREVRYAFLHRLAQQIGAAVVAVAHHADDQAETVLHRILRGTGLRGLAGMPEQRPIETGSDIQIVRPLLAMRRKDFIAYLRRRGIEYMHDVTNEDVLAATRNRIRHELLPQIEQTINPNVAAALVRLAEQADRAGRAIRDLAETALKDIHLGSNDGGICLDATALTRLPRALQTEIVVMVVERLGSGLRDLGTERIEAVVDAAIGDGGYRRIELPGRLAAERRGNRLRFKHLTRASDTTLQNTRTAKETCP
jgi:tRNA(Ile)-lysidine synthase